MKLYYLWVGLLLLISCENNCLGLVKVALSSKCKAASRLFHIFSSAAPGVPAESTGVATMINYLNSDKGNPILSAFYSENEGVKMEMGKVNFWSSGNYIIEKVICDKITQEGLSLTAKCKIKGKSESKSILVPHPFAVTDENMVKASLIVMLQNLGRIADTAEIMKLPFGYDGTLPKNFLFNNVPHYAWVRSYLYEAATEAVLRAIEDESIPNKSRLQMRVNIPEVNPAFDTYRIGTLLELVRTVTLNLTVQRRMRVRICVQQALGEGVFTGLPLALSSMKPVLERMDWGPALDPDEKFRLSDYKQPRKEALVRLGAVGKDQVADDDDVIIVICPQNVIGGVIIDLLDEMVREAKGRTVIILNPLLQDRPSSNNMMQIRGRKERQAIADSFTDIFVMKLLYPSNGGYMYPIRGMIGKKSYHSPWVIYEKCGVNQDEVYEIRAALDPYKPPDPAIVSSVLI